MKLQKVTTIIIISFLLASCESMNKQQTGALIGGASGAVLGSFFGKGSGRVGATAIGAIAGAAIGSSIGSNMDKKDQMYHMNSSHKALEFSPTGQAVEWRNPDNGHHGSITPIKTYQAQNGLYCREYTQDVHVAGKTQQAYGKACRQPDGTWKIVE